MKEKVIKAICIASVLSMTLSFTACSSSNEPTDNSYNGTSDNNYTVNTSKNFEQIIANATLQYPSSNDEYEYNVYDTYIKITNYIGSDTNVEIPDTLDNLPVLVIGRGAFAYKNITSVIIPNSIVLMEDDPAEGFIGLFCDQGAFSECKNLTNVVIGSSDIGEFAFHGCTSLTSVEISNSVTSIADSAFYGCESLTNVEIPNSVTSIGYDSFSGCTSLTNVEIPNSLTSIGIGAFSGCTSLTNVEIPNSVTSVGSGAFIGCKNLTSLTIYSADAKIQEGNGIVSSFTTIYGYAGSTAAQYCAKYGYNFKLIE